MSQGAPQQRIPDRAPSPPVRQIFSHPVILILCLAGSVLAIYLMDLLLPDSLAAVLLDKERGSYP